MRASWGPKKKIGPSCNFLGVLTPVASKANQTPIRSSWDSIQPWTFFSKSLPKPIGTIRLFHEALWASYETLTKPSWIFVDSWNFFSNPVQSLSKPHRIVSNPGFFFPNVFPSLLGLYDFTWEPLGDQKKKIRPSCNFFGVLTPVSSKACQTPIRSSWDFHDSFWASYEALTKPSWIFVDSGNFFSEPCPKPIKAS